MKALIMTLFLMLPIYPFTEEDVNLLADVAYLENGSTGKDEAENREVLILTMAVVLNRVEDGGWGGKTIKEVIYSPGQYAVSTKDGIGKVKTPQYIKDLTREVLTKGTNVPKYVVYQSTQKNLGTIWKIIDGECFATTGGHKDEGYSMVAEVNSSWCSDVWVFTDVLRSACYRERVVSTIRDAWRTYNHVVGRCLDMAYRCGGKDS